MPRLFRGLSRPRTLKDPPRTVARARASAADGKASWGEIGSRALPFSLPLPNTQPSDTRVRARVQASSIRRLHF